MREIARSDGRRSELEVSQLPEVAALATALTTLFNGLEVPQQRYAARVAMDKSTVSRYLNGRRVANQDFINRLFAELERHRGTAITEETRSRVHRLRLNALRVSDPQSFEVENLRDEVDKSHRAIKNLRRQQEALELLLDQKEESARETERQLELMRGDWVAEQVKNEASLLTLTGENQRFAEEADALRTEIEDLRQQLAEVNRLRQDAEERCTDLQGQLAEAEEKLADRLNKQVDRDFPFSPAEVAELVSLAHGEQRFNEAARLLSLAAAYFDGGETVSLWKRISRSRRGSIDAIRLLDDAIRFGSVDTVASIAEAALKTSSRYTQPNIQQTLATSIASSKTTKELLALYHRWHTGGPTYRIMRTALPIWSEDASPTDVFDFLRVLHEHDDSTLSVRILHAYGTRSAREVIRLISLYESPRRKDDVSLLIHRWYTRIKPMERRYSVQEWNLLADNWPPDKVPRLTWPG